MRNAIINEICKWQKAKDQAIPDSSYYYYCFGIIQGYKFALEIIEKGGK